MADPTQDPFWQARTLLRAARAATLATQADGQPLASLTLAACAHDLSLLLLLSDLSEHTRHLRTEARCSLMVVGAKESENPMTAPRTSITGLAEISHNPAEKSRYLAIHPYATLYADFGDFNLWRIRPLGGQFVGGFARANRLRREHLTPDADAVARLQAAEAEICEHCNTDHPDTLALLAGAPGDWRMVTADVDGCDLAQGETTMRVAWSGPVEDAGGVRKELIRLATQRRKDALL